MDITVEGAAQRLGISTSTVKRRLERGQIAGRKIGRQWVVDDSRLPAPTRSDSPKPVPLSSVNVGDAVRYVRATDLNELWVPDVLRWTDFIANPTDLLSEAAVRAATGTCDAATLIEVPKTPMLTRPAAILALADR